MNGPKRLTALLLALAMLLQGLCASAASQVRVYIPDTAMSLSLPGMPEVPVILGQPPAAASPGAGYMVSFSSRVESAQLLYADQAVEMALSPDGQSASVQHISAAKPTGILVTSDLLTVCYAGSGYIRYIELAEKADRFFTGQKDPLTIIRWDCTVMATNGEPYLIWRISSVTARYREGSYIPKVLVRYQGDQTMSVSDYEITYSPKAGDTYLIRYGKADHVVSGEYTDGQVTLVNGSGRHFWENAWYDANTGRQSAKSGLLACTSFESPRVRTR